MFSGSGVVEMRTILFMSLRRRESPNYFSIFFSCFISHVLIIGNLDTKYLHSSFVKKKRIPFITELTRRTCLRIEELEHFLKQFEDTDCVIVTKELNTIIGKVSFIDSISNF